MARKRIPVWLANLLLVLQAVGVVAVVYGIVLLSLPVACIVGGAIAFTVVEAIARSDR